MSVKVFDTIKTEVLNGVVLPVLKPKEKPQLSIETMCSTVVLYDFSGKMFSVKKWFCNRYICVLSSQKMETAYRKDSCALREQSKYD